VTGPPAPGIAPRPGDGRYAPSNIGSSGELLAPGLRTLARPGWRGSVATALAVVLSNPWLWLLGALGFAVRGGIFLLALLIIVLPTPVEVRQLLGENLSSSGLTPAFLGLLVSIAGAALIVVGGALLLAAGVELAAFRRFVSDPESGLEAGRAGGAVAADTGRRGLLAWLFVVQLAAAVLVALAALPLAVSVYDATTQELLRPTPGGEVLYIRVLSAVREPLLFLLIAIVLIDLLTASVSRHLMTGHYGLAAPSGLVPRLARRPLGLLATAALTWLLSAVVLVPVAWVVDIAWDATRSAYLGQRAEVDPQALAWLAVVTVVFAAMWAAAVLAAGFVSALRAGLWTAESLR
jgi:hypothetical protein